MNKFLLVMILIWSQASIASFYDYKAEGWFWFEENNKEEVVLEKLPQEQHLSHSQQMELLQLTLKEKMHKAMMEPSEANVKEYISYQKQITNQAQDFSKVWQRVILKNPELDENVNNPGSQMGRHILYAKQEQEEREKLFALSKTHGLIYFYGGKCSYCHAFSPIVSNFAKRYGFEVMAITMDNVISEYFPNSKRNNGIAQNLNITSWPTLLAFNSKTGEIIPIANGLISEADMVANIMLITKEE